MGLRTMTAVAAVALVATACGGGSGPDVTGDGAGGDGLVGAWQLQAAEPAIDVPDATRVTLTIEPDGDQLRAGGTAACNSYGGLLTADGGTWQLDELGWTEMGCEQAWMAAEAAYLDALLQIETWAVDGDVLTLTGPGATLTFAQLPEVEPAAMTGTTWVLDGLVTGTGDDAAVTSVTAGVDPAELRLDDDGTFTLYSGCRDFAGDWTTSGDEIVWPSWGQTEDSRGVAANGDLTCSAAAEDQERAVLGVLEGSFVPVVDGERLTVQQGGAGLVFRAS